MSNRQEFMPVRPYFVAHGPADITALRAERDELTALLDTQNPPASPPDWATRREAQTRLAEVQEILSQLEDRHLHRPEQSQSSSAQPAMVVDVDRCGRMQRRPRSFTVPAHVEAANATAEKKAMALMRREAAEPRFMPARAPGA